ncbi:50S ribosomal protein L18 [bacterium]|jgi:large subunit ribosomal protein L18|nr:50S ribosomal protein L18 [bacterium]MBT3581159.1 50S ribosomal protein L18 [bacterium]MBT4551592.1 50S ribosomal protein L18 [bacterium]MBT7087806.1 50S ribosomal protein L18 [bacterium]
MRKARKKRPIKSSKDRLRLSIYKSNTNLYAQVIDDEKMITVLGVNSKKHKKGNKVEDARELGKVVAEKAKSAGVSKVVYDRGGKTYKGRIKAFAEAARENGLIF